MFSPFSWTKVASSSWYSREVSTNLDLSTAINDEGKFLLAARRCRHATCTDYIVSLNAEDVSKGSSTYIGKLRLAMLSILPFPGSILYRGFDIQHLHCRSNFLGTKFTVYDAQPPSSGARMGKCRSIRLVGMKQVAPRVPAGYYPVAHISYELNVLGSR